MNNNKNRIDCVQFIDFFKHKVDYIRIINYANNSQRSEWLSHSKNTTSEEFLLINKTSNFAVFIIKNKRELHLSSDNLDILKNNIEDSLKTILDLPEDVDSVIPGTHDLTVHDEQLLYKPNQATDLHNLLEKSLKENYKNYLENFTCNHSIIILEKHKILVDSHNFIYSSHIIETNCSIELITDHNNKKEIVWDTCTINNKSKITPFILKNLHELHSKLGAIDIKTSKYPCIMDKDVFAQCIDEILPLLCGQFLDDKSSYYLNSLHKKIFSDDINIIERPKSDYCNISYDYEGNKLCEKHIVKDGVLQLYLINDRYSKKLKQPKSGNGFESTCVTSVFIESNHKFDSKNFHSGVLINDLVDHDLNVTTGDFKASCSGILIDKEGKKTSFRNAILSFNLETLQRIQLVDDELSSDSYIFSHSVYFSEIDISGV